MDTYTEGREQREDYAHNCQSKSIYYPSSLYGSVCVSADGHRKRDVGVGVLLCTVCDTHPFNMGSKKTTCLRSSSILCGDM
jgi:hypothetical protein